MGGRAGGDSLAGEGEGNGGAGEHGLDSLVAGQLNGEEGGIHFVLRVNETDVAGVIHQVGGKTELAAIGKDFDDLGKVVRGVAGTGEQRGGSEHGFDNAGLDLVGDKKQLVGIGAEKSDALHEQVGDGGVNLDRPRITGDFAVVIYAALGGLGGEGDIGDLAVAHADHFELLDLHAAGRERHGTPPGKDGVEHPAGRIVLVMRKFDVAGFGVLGRGRLGPRGRRAEQERGGERQ